MELVKINHEEFGLEEVKAREISSLFKPMLDTMVELEKEYNEILKLPLSPETYKKARELRLRYVKVRTGTDKIHKNAKAHYRKVGLFIDSWKNAQLLTSEGNEAKLFEIENHEAIERKKAIVKLNEERLIRVREFEPDFDDQTNLGEMSEIFWDTFITGVEARYNKQIEEEKAAEKERKRLAKIRTLHEARKAEIRDLWKYVDNKIELNFGEYPKNKWEEFKKELIKKEVQEKIHKLRKESLLPYWNYLEKEVKEENFGTWKKEFFDGLLKDLKEKDAEVQAQIAADKIKAEEEEQKRKKSEQLRKKEREKRINAERKQKMFELGFKFENNIFTYYSLSVKLSHLLEWSEIAYKNNVSIIKRKKEKIDEEINIKDEKSGIELISIERQEQLEKHQRTIKDDYKYNDEGELITGAEALLNESPSWADFPDHWNKQMVENMCKKTYTERLIIAGAFIAAEVDRLKYKQIQEKNGN